MCVEVDEVGGNLIMGGDGNIIGELLLYKKNSVSHQKIFTKDKHFTLLQLTLLTRDPLMCILIILEKKPDALTEMIIGFSVEMISKEGNTAF